LKYSSTTISTAESDPPFPSGELTPQPEASATEQTPFFHMEEVAAAILGLLDDTHDLKPKVKFFWQFLIAVAFAYFGFCFEFFHLPGFPIIVLGWLAIPITALWIVAVLKVDIQHQGKPPLSRDDF